MNRRLKNPLIRTQEFQNVTVLTCVKAARLHMNYEPYVRKQKHVLTGRQLAVSVWVHEQTWTDVTRQSDSARYGDYLFTTVKYDKP
jgi:hypothetical protein